MSMSYAHIDEESRKYFYRVLPEHMELAGKRVALGAVDEEGYVLGAISFVLIDFEYVIDWIYVEPTKRRQGIGMGLVEAVIQFAAKSQDLFPVVARFEFMENDRAMHTFFLSCKYMETNYSHERYYITANDIRNIRTLHKSAAQDVVVENFFDRPVEEQKKILARLAIEETYTVDDYERWKEECIQELCRCVFVKNNLVDLIFMQRLPDGNLVLSYLYGKYPKGLFELLVKTVADVEALFPDVSLTFDAMSEESQKLADHLFPRAKAVHIYEAEF